MWRARSSDRHLRPINSIELNAASTLIAISSADSAVIVWSASIGLVTRQEISLVLSDLTGREIAVLERGVVEAGSSDIVFDASGLHSGSYILTLRGTGGIVSTYLVVRR